MYHRAILLVLLATPLANSLLSLSDVGDIISFTHEVVIDVLQAWKLVSPLLEGEGPDHIDLPIIKNKEKKLLSKIAEVNRRVGNVDKAIQSITSASLLNFKQDFPSQIRLELRIDTLLEFISMINFADHAFQEYTKNDFINNKTDTEESGSNFERHTLESFATYVVSHTPSSVQGVMDRLHGMIHPDGDQGRAFLHTGVLTLIRNVLQIPKYTLTTVSGRPNGIRYSDEVTALSSGYQEYLARDLGVKVQKHECGVSAVGRGAGTFTY